jgi:hypothetical protein
VFTKIGSWVVTRKATGEVIGEFFDPKNVAKFNPATTTVEPIGVYLARMNRTVQQAKPQQDGNQ